MIYYNSKKDMLVGKCDACGIQMDGYKGETDKCEFTCGLFKENGWLQRKVNGKWKHFCPACKEEFYKAKRERYFFGASEKGNI